MVVHRDIGNTGDYRALKQAVPCLPAAWYFDPSHHRTELASIWRRCWIYAFRGDSLAAPLSYRTVQIGDQNIFVLRDEAGGLKAYHNTCRHRGSILLTEATGRLKSKAIVCPYHQWCYRGDNGRLVKTSSFAEPDGFDKAEYGLFPVSVREWRGFVFVNIDPEAVWDADAIFHRSSGEVSNFPLEEMVVGHSWRKVMACNWKTFWDNFNECLHCPNVHPELADLVPLYGRRLVDPKDPPDWQDHDGDPDPKYRGGLRVGAETWSMDGSAQGHLIETLSKEDLARGQSYTVSLPSAFIAAYADHVRIVRLLPLGPEETELVSEWLFPPATLNAKGYDVANVVNFAKLVMRQDLVASELNQRGLHAAPMERGVLMPEEYYVKAFQDWVCQAVENAGVI